MYSSTHPPKKISLNQTHINHLIAQRDHLLLVRNFHCRQMEETNDPETWRTHHQLADLLEQSADLYKVLLDAAQNE